MSIWVYFGVLWYININSERRATPASGRDQKSIDFQLNSLRKISFQSAEATPASGRDQKSIDFN